MLRVGRLARTNHVDMRGQTALGIPQSDGSSDHKAPIATLGYILLVTERLHQLIADFRILCQAKPRLLDPFGPAEVGETRCYNVERDSLIRLTEDW